MRDDVDEWRAFYDASFGQVSSYARRLTGGDRAAAEDLVHDAYVAMVAAWQAGSVDRLGTGWLIVAVRRKFLNQLRSDEREQRQLAVVGSVPATVDEADDDAVELLAPVHPRGRLALVLRHVDGYSVPDVAAAMGISVHAAESVLARARREVRASVRPAGRRVEGER